MVLAIKSMKNVQAKRKAQALEVLVISSEEEGYIAQQQLLPSGMTREILETRYRGCYSRTSR